MIFKREKVTGCPKCDRDEDHVTINIYRDEQGIKVRAHGGGIDPCSVIGILETLQAALAFDKLGEIVENDGPGNFLENLNNPKPH